jgi:hypothetical protein
MGYKRPTITVNGEQIGIARYIMEKHLGRKLKSCELVHHIDCNTSNNDISNLLLTDRAGHKKIHSSIGKNTRFKQKYNFNDTQIMEEYIKNPRTELICEKYHCHAITIERKIKSILKLKTVKGFRKSILRGNYETYLCTAR